MQLLEFVSLASCQSDLPQLTLPSDTGRKFICFSHSRCHWQNAKCSHFFSDDDKTPPWKRCHVGGIHRDHKIVPNHISLGNIAVDLGTLNTPRLLSRVFSAKIGISSQSLAAKNLLASVPRLLAKKTFGLSVF